MKTSVLAQSLLDIAPSLSLAPITEICTSLIASVSDSLVVY